MLARVLIGNDNDKLGNLAVLHPPVQGRHDAFYVRLDLVVGRDEHVEAIFLDDGEVFGGVDAALVEDGVDGVLELSVAKRARFVSASLRAHSCRFKVMRIAKFDNAARRETGPKTYEFGNQLGAALERELVHLGDVLFVLCWFFRGGHGDEVLLGFEKGKMLYVWKYRECLLFSLSPRARLMGFGQSARIVVEEGFGFGRAQSAEKLGLLDVRGGGICLHWGSGCHGLRLAWGRGVLDDDMMGVEFRVRVLRSLSYECP